ncbi:hypothetical protein BG011_007562 [Mortierella polycephala]|uniref:RING-type domain-containing protein n=1 Tax=Mortierella polycephala TaxID=41804 RepID=A0A9P6U8F7_9FUNG|nr:hypothetical protein BG011_007562 [Mortierella polycephala]
MAAAQTPNVPAHGGNGKEGMEWDKDLTFTASVSQDESSLSFLQPASTVQQYSFLRQNAPGELLSGSSSRRNSRILPNPIQPPSASHGSKNSVDESDHMDRDQQQPFFMCAKGVKTGSDPEVNSNEQLSTSSSFSMQSNQGLLQHGGFVPGFNIWTSEEKHSAPAAKDGFYISGMYDILSPRRRSESILQELSADDLGMITFNPATSNSTSVLPTSSSSSTRSASPPDSSDSSGQPSSTVFGEDLLDHDEDSAKDDCLSSQQQFGTSEVCRPNFAAAYHHSDTSTTTIGAREGGDLNDICGLCGLQVANVLLGSCGHRVCAVCHQYEKHRSMRLFQSATPPCPFCIHGVAPTSLPQSSNTTLTQSESIKQQRHSSFPPLPRQPYSVQSHPMHQQQSTPSRQKQIPQTFGNIIPGDVDNELTKSRQQNNIFPVYGAAHATAFLRSTSTQHPNSATSATSTKSLGLNVGNHARHQELASGLLTLKSSNSGSNAKHQQHSYSSGRNQYISNVQNMAMFLNQDQQYEIINNNATTVGQPGLMAPMVDTWNKCISGTDRSSQRLSYPQQQQIPYQPQNQQKRGTQSHGLQAHYSNINDGMVSNLSSAMAFSFSILPNLPPALPPITPRTEAISWAVVRVTNIPWDISLHDMFTFFNGFPCPPEHLLPQNVHILMERGTGKTINSAFVELALTPHQAGMVAEARNLKVLKGRVVTVELSSQDELMRNVFPKWVGQFVNGEPVVPGERLNHLIAAAEKGSGGRSETTTDIHQDPNGQAGSNGKRDSSLDISIPGMLPIGSSGSNGIIPAAYTPPFVSREEINALLVVCRNYKLHFSRKCAERPFENILTILSKYPWHQPYRVLPLHRDHVFELLKLAIESLRQHLRKEYNTIHPTLLTRMVRCAILTPAFTERQKAMVLTVAGCDCPDDIVGWMSPQAPADVESGSDSVDTGTIINKEETVSQVVQDKKEKRQELAEADIQIEVLGISDASVPESTTDYHEPKPTNGDCSAPGIDVTVVDTKQIFVAETHCETAVKSRSQSLMVATTNAPSAAVLVQPHDGISKPDKLQAPVVIKLTSSSAPFKSGSHKLTLAPSYAAAVVQDASVPNVLPNYYSGKMPKSFCALANHTDVVASSAGSGSDSTLSKASPTNTKRSHIPLQQQLVARSLSTSGFSSTVASAVTPHANIGMVPYVSQSHQATNERKVEEVPVAPNVGSVAAKSCEDSMPTTQQHGTQPIPNNVGCTETLPWLTMPAVMAKTASSSSIASLSSAPSTTTALSIHSPDFPPSPSLQSLTSGPMPVTDLNGKEERSKSESILDAIKTITQSTPRLSKSSAVHQVGSTLSPSSPLNSLAMGVQSNAGFRFGHKQQRRETGEAL